MREFYVYGFKRRQEYGAKSSRSYDNERRRLESWLGDDMYFRQTPAGKQVFISVNCREAAHNPLYRAFRAKSFTDNDILFHFIVLDLLHGGIALTLDGIVSGMGSVLPDRAMPDESTIRKKLKEYTSLGILKADKQGQRMWYRLSGDRIDLKGWADSIAFFSEAAPLGVIGSYLADHPRMGGQDGGSPFRFRNHYILTALDSEVFFLLARAVRERRRAVIGMWTVSGSRVVKHDICPARFFIGTQNGRQYVLAARGEDRSPTLFRLDLIRSVALGDPEPAFEQLRRRCDGYRKYLWGVSGTEKSRIAHLEMLLRIPGGDRATLQRLKRERRGGTAERAGDGLWRFSADVYDPLEMLPWIRTFTGKIVSLKCTDPRVADRYYDDLEKLSDLYGGDENDLP